MSRKRRAATSAGAQGAFKLFLVFLVLSGINVYVFFFSPGNLKSVSKAAQAASLGPPPRPIPPATPLVKHAAREGTVREAEGLGSALRRDGVRASDVDAALRALRPLVDFKRQIQAGQKYRLRLAPGGLLWALELKAPSGHFVVTRWPDGSLLAGKRAAKKATR